MRSLIGCLLSMAVIAAIFAAIMLLGFLTNPNRVDHGASNPACTYGTYADCG